MAKKALLARIDALPTELSLLIYQHLFSNNYIRLQNILDHERRMLSIVPRHHLSRVRATFYSSNVFVASSLPVAGSAEHEVLNSRLARTHTVLIRHDWRYPYLVAGQNSFLLRRHRDADGALVLRAKSRCPLQERCKMEVGAWAREFQAWCVLDEDAKDEDRVFLNFVRGVVEMAMYGGGRLERLERV